MTHIDPRLSVSAEGNTTQGSTASLYASNLLLRGAGNISVGMSNGSIVVSATGGGGVESASLYATGNTTQSSSGVVALSAFTVRGEGIARAGVSNGSLVVSVVQSNQQMDMYAVGNTTLSSSASGVANAQSFRGEGIVSVGASNGSAVISATQLNQAVSAEGGSSTFQTLSFLNANGASFSNNGGGIQVSYTVPVTAGLISSAATATAVGNTTQATSGSIDLRSQVFRGAGNVSVGISNGSIVISATGAEGGGITNINLSAGTTSNNLSAMTLSDSHGVSFGLNGSVVTASHNGLTTQTVQQLIAYAVSNTTQSSVGSLTATNMSLIAHGMVSAGVSNGSLVFSAPSPVLTVNAAGTTTLNSTGTVDFRSLTFRANGDISVGINNGLVIYSVVQSAQVVSTPNGGSTFQTIAYANTNGVSWGHDGQTVTASVRTRDVVYVVQNSTSSSVGSMFDGNWSLRGYGIVSIGALDGSVQISAIQTNQQISAYALGNTVLSSSRTMNASAFSVVGEGIVSVGASAGSLVVSASVASSLTAINLSAGTTSNNLSAMVLSNSNEGNRGWVSFGLDASTVTASVNVGVQQIFAGTQDANAFLNIPNSNNFTFGISHGSELTAAAALNLYAVGNTTQSSSGSRNITNIEFRGAGVASVGVTDGSVVISVPAGGGGITNINVSAGTTSNNLSALTFSNSHGLGFGLNGSVITAAHSLSLYGGGNTTVASSTTINASALSLEFVGNMSGGFANGTVLMYAAGRYSASNTSVQVTRLHYGNSNGLSFGLSTGIDLATLTASYGRSVQIYGSTAGANSSAVWGGGSPLAITANGGIEIRVDNNELQLEAVPPNRSYIEIHPANRMTTALAASHTGNTNRPVFLPFWMDGANMAVNTIRFIGSNQASSNRSLGMTLRAGLYIATSSNSLSLLASASQSFSYTASSESSLWNGGFMLDFTGFNYTITKEGRYALAVQINPVSANATWASMALWGGDNIPLLSRVLVGNTTSATNNTSHIYPFWGVYSTTTAGLPAGVNITQINGGNSLSLRDIYALIKEV